MTIIIRERSQLRAVVLREGRSSACLRCQSLLRLLVLRGATPPPRHARLCSRASRKCSLPAPHDAHCRRAPAAAPPSSSSPCEPRSAAACGRPDREGTESIPPQAAPCKQNAPSQSWGLHRAHQS
eukprot:2553237-Rhodomonas_salina.2